MIPNTHFYFSKGPYNGQHPGSLLFRYCLFEGLDLLLLLYRAQLWCGDRFGIEKDDIQVCMKTLSESVLVMMMKDNESLPDIKVESLKSNLENLDKTISSHKFPGWSWLETWKKVCNHRSIIGALLCNVVGLSPILQFNYIL